jgi:DNA adenine methylase
MATREGKAGTSGPPDRNGKQPEVSSTPAGSDLRSSRRNGKPPGISRLKTGRKLILFGWYGGKFSHLDWLLPLLPRCHHYCEPFAGSAAVLLNRAPSPVETYNDLDGEVVNFFRVLRDDGEALARAIGLTPFSREEFALACTLDSALPPVERARRFYVRARQVRTGLNQTASIGRWANCKNTSRSGMSGVISRWLGGVEVLSEIAERLIRVQIENRPAIDVIRLYDSPTTLFYCDPPYAHETRGDAKAYRYEMTDAEHDELATVLNSAKGKVAFSNYDCGLLNDLYPSPKWRKVVSPPKTNHATKGRRTEVLWTNYDPPGKGDTQTLF